MAKKKRGRPPGSKSKNVNVEAPKKRGRPPAATATSKKSTPAAARKAAVAPKPLVKKAPATRKLPDLVSGLYCIVAQEVTASPDGGDPKVVYKFLTPSGSFSDDRSTIMPYDSQRDADDVLLNLKKEIEAGDAVIDPIAKDAEAVPYKRYLANSYVINPTTNAVICSLELKETAIPFSAAVREIKAKMNEQIKALKHEQKLALAEYEARLAASGDHVLDAEATLERFSRYMGAYG